MLEAIIHEALAESEGAAMATSGGLKTCLIVHVVDVCSGHKQLNNLGSEKGLTWEICFSNGYNFCNRRNKKLIHMSLA